MNEVSAVSYELTSLNVQLVAAANLIHLEHNDESVELRIFNWTSSIQRGNRDNMVIIMVWVGHISYTNWGVKMKYQLMT